MVVTVPKEGEIWQLAVKTIGTQALQTLVGQLLKDYFSTRSVDIVGYLRLEWLGYEALEALRAGLRLAGKESKIFQDDPSAVALLNGHRACLIRGIVQAIPTDQLREDLLVWRLQLDLGM